jgi:hypothetical protein
VKAESAPSPPVQDGKPVIFAESDGDATQPAKRLQSPPILERFPEGYEGGFFKLDGRDVVIGATGMPDLRLENAL